MIGSSAPNGSSISSTAGSAASARATPTRCCWPPDNSCGSFVGVDCRVELEQSEQFGDARCRSSPCPSPAGWARSRCCAPPSNAETGRGPGWRSRCRGAVARRAKSRCRARRCGCVPLVGSIRRLIMRSSVDLPLPEVPTSTAIVAAFDAKRDVVDGERVAEGAADIFDFDHVRRPLDDLDHGVEQDRRGEGERDRRHGAEQHEIGRRLSDALEHEGRRSRRRRSARRSSRARCSGPARCGCRSG